MAAQQKEWELCSAIDEHQGKATADPRLGPAPLARRPARWSHCSGGRASPGAGFRQCSPRSRGSDLWAVWRHRHRVSGRAAGRNARTGERTDRADERDGGRCRQQPDRRGRREPSQWRGAAAPGDGRRGAGRTVSDPVWPAEAGPLHHPGALLRGLGVHVGHRHHHPADPSRPPAGNPRIRGSDQLSGDGVSAVPPQSRRTGRGADDPRGGVSHPQTHQPGAARTAVGSAADHSVISPAVQRPTPGSAGVGGTAAYRKHS